MSIHLNSKDVNTGSIYNGTWNFTKSIIGAYKLVYQDFSSESVPWVFPGCNTLTIENFNNLGQISVLTLPGLAIDDTTLIQTWLTDAINSSGWVTVTSSNYDNATNRYTFNFSTPVLIQYSPDSSSVAYVFNWVYANPLSSNPTSSLVIDGRYMYSSPKILEVHCDQIQSQSFNVNGDNPSFFLSTFDGFVNNQNVTVNSEVNSLSLKIYRPNNHSAPVPISNEFDIIFKPF